MLTSTFSNIKISGVACALPTKKIYNYDYSKLFGEEHVKKVISSTGIESSYHVNEHQTAGDLAFAAADHLLSTFNIDRTSIGALVFVVSYPDYFAPATACVIQKRLGLTTDCIVFDINMACSGFLYGLHTVSSLMQTTNIKKALVLVGDSTSKVVSSQDKSRMLFGDAGGAALLELVDAGTPMNFGMKNDGSRFKSIIVPAGGFRLRNAAQETEEWMDGNIRSSYNLFMNGTDVFNFAMVDVPRLLKDFIEYFNINVADVDSFVFHQPNAFILKHLAKKAKIPFEKMPLSLTKYGNTSGVSIPVTLCDTFGCVKNEFKKIFSCAFGVGLSWSVCNFNIDTNVILPIIHTDDYYRDGYVNTK